VLTAADLPRFPELPPPSAVRVMPFSDDRIRYEGQPVAIVLAESVEAAEAGRAVVAVDCERETPVLIGHGRREPAMGSDEVRGDVDAALAAAAITIEQTYLQAPRHHHTMETSGTVARWDGGRLTLWDSVQASSTVIPVVSAAFGLDAADVRVVAPHTGGGFGAKGYIWPHEILAAAAARVAGRPVKLHLRRPDQFSNVGYQPWMEQTIRLGATADGVLLGLEHEVVNNTALADTHVEPATEASKSLYAVPALRLRQLIERVSLNVPTPMRAPVEGPGLWALESAMNELADAAGLDPLDVRLANFAEVSPADGRPWSSNGLREAYEEGARRYGWRTRYQRPRREGPWVIGHGMATCSMGSFRFPGAGRVRLRRDGAVVEANVHDIGTGVQTVLSQIAAEELGISLDRVETRWGDTDLPATGPTYGSSTTMGTGSAVAAAARDVSKQLAELGLGGRDPLDALDRAGIDELVGEGTFELPGGQPVQPGRRGHAVRDQDLGRDLHRGRRRPRLRAAAAAPRGRRLFGWPDHQPGHRPRADDRRHHLGLGQGHHGGERSGAGARTVAGQEPVQRGGTGQRRYPGRHRRLVHRRVRRDGQPDRGAGHRRARRHRGGRGRRRRGARRRRDPGARPAHPAVEGAGRLISAERSGDIAPITGQPGSRRRARPPRPGPA
jgi:xanthine dehydrogenase YagR molybdenum-binding subunit